MNENTFAHVVKKYPELMTDAEFQAAYKAMFLEQEGVADELKDVNQPLFSPSTSLFLSDARQQYVGEWARISDEHRKPNEKAMKIDAELDAYLAAQTPESAAFIRQVLSTEPGKRNTLFESEKNPDLQQAWLDFNSKFESVLGAAIPQSQLVDEAQKEKAPADPAALKELAIDIAREHKFGNTAFLEKYAGMDDDKKAAYRKLKSKNEKIIGALDAFDAGVLVLEGKDGGRSVAGVPAPFEKEENPAPASQVETRSGEPSQYPGDAKSIVAVLQGGVGEGHKTFDAYVNVLNTKISSPAEFDGHLGQLKTYLATPDAERGTLGNHILGENGYAEFSGRAEAWEERGKAPSPLQQRTHAELEEEARMAPPPLPLEAFFTGRDPTKHRTREEEKRDACFDNLKVIVGVKGQLNQIAEAIGSLNRYDLKPVDVNDPDSPCAIKAPNAKGVDTTPPPRK